MEYKTEFLHPFGLEIGVPLGSTWETLPLKKLQQWLGEHRLLVLRGVERLNSFQLVAAARGFGPVQSWSFGAINHLEVDDEAKNYLFTEREVPLHWDGAFAGECPCTLVFQCLETPESEGGETFFVDTAKVLQIATEEEVERWSRQSYEYSTDTIAHYGGCFTAELVQKSPKGGEQVLRYAEPVMDINPVDVKPVGKDEEEGRLVMAEMSEVLHHPDVKLCHQWKKGDIVIADNDVLLHGRNAFSGGHRHIQRVNALHAKKPTWLSYLGNSLKIRRPEFLVAEIPILLLPLLWLGKHSFWQQPYFWEAVALFFLLFHVGDMVNCYADRDLDAVHKGHLSRAVYELGLFQVKLQIAITTVLCILLATHVSWCLRRPVILFLVVIGLVLGGMYSLQPFQLKGRGLWQIITLWAIIIVGPMSLIHTIFQPIPSLMNGCMIAAYGVLQQGIIIINTAEDFEEDREAGVYTSVRFLGLQRSIAFSSVMVGIGGFLLCCLGLFVQYKVGTVWSCLGLTLFFLVWLYVLAAIVGLWREVKGLEVATAAKVIKAKARWMPLWITATAWSFFFFSYLGLYLSLVQP